MGAQSNINKKVIQKSFDERIKRNKQSTNQYIADEIKQTIIQKRLVDSGQLLNSVSSTEDEVLINAPYARRIEYGFTGKDSLGRVYNQSPNPFIAPTLVRIDQELSKRMAKE